MAAGGGSWKSGTFQAAGGAIDPITKTRVGDLSNKKLIRRRNSEREGVNITKSVLARTEKEARNSGPEYANRILGIARDNYASALSAFKALDTEYQKRLAKQNKR